MWNGNIWGSIVLKWLSLLWVAPYDITRTKEYLLQMWKFIFSLLEKSKMKSSRRNEYPVLGNYWPQASDKIQVEEFLMEDRKNGLDYLKSSVYCWRFYAFGFHYLASVNWGGKVENIHIYYILRSLHTKISLYASHSVECVNFFWRVMGWHVLTNSYTQLLSRALTGEYNVVS